ncbi:MAG: hypothetical protein WA964_08375 [Ilumatobacter sp.]|uniref:hypothetical protein n=1 Tax=Ilumatobacter sp. TaxID=1967498 RepID=UPI003C757236
MPDEPAAETDPVVLARAALETLVFAPIGLGAKLVDDAPAAVRRVRQELSNARFIGRLTVEQGAARLRDRVPATVEGARGERSEVADVATVDVLPIEGYDELPAIEIVGMLADLTPAQRDVVAEHEMANRRRRTVLGKIAQLAE